MNHTPTRILILGGGFGGISCALQLAKLNHPKTHIRLISDHPHFEYHGALYRLVTGHSPLEICIPLRKIFTHTPVEVVIDSVKHLDISKQIVKGSNDSIYGYDILVLALGSQTNLSHIPGLEKYAFEFKSVSQALRLQRHLHQLINKICASPDKPIQLQMGRIVVVGGGASGVELAAELVLYLKKIAKHHHLDPNLLSVDLIHSSPRLLPNLPIVFSHRVEKRIRSLGINLHLNRRLVKETANQVFLKDLHLYSQTLIWTAGVCGHQLYRSTSNLKLDESGKIQVLSTLQTLDHPQVFALGDSAATKYSGMAQTAIEDGLLAANNIIRLISKQTLITKKDKKPIYAIPIGGAWSASLIGDRQFFGKIGWIIRRYLDWHVFHSLLPLNQALNTFKSSSQPSETCPVCNNTTTD